MAAHKPERSRASLGSLIKKPFPKPCEALDIRVPIRNGQEIVSEASDSPVQASPPVHASVQTDSPPGAVISQQSTRIVRSSYQSIGSHVVGPAQIPTPIPEPPRLNCWEKAKDSLKANEPEAFRRLGVMEQLIKEKEQKFTLQEPPDLLKRFESKKRKAGGIPLWTQSVFRSILAVRDVIAVAANFDPHHAAPVAWRGFCVILEALVNDSTILEDSKLSVNDVTSKIKHWANIEIFYIGASSHVTVNRFQALETSLIQMYSAILEFEVEVFHWCNHNIAAQVVLSLSSDRKERWRSMVSKIEAHHGFCLSTFDDCKTTIDKHKKIRSWISTYDAEEAQEQILEKTQANGKYQDCGEWLISSVEFKKWSLVDPKSTGSVLWLRGTVGTGKTTLLCRVIEWHLERRCLYPDHRFAIFYCTGAQSSKTPYETVLLAVLCQAAYDIANGAVSRNILDAYKHVGAGVDDLNPLRFSRTKYQELLGGILKSGVRLRVMIDALDQCDKPAELLKVLRDASNESPSQIELFLSSQSYVQVEKKLPDAVIVDINKSMPADDMVTYVTTEIKRREDDEKLLEGQEGELEDELVQILCEKAGKMFRWVELQLNYFLSPDRTILKEQVRRDLTKLKKGPVTNEQVLYATYDDVFNRNTREGSFDRDASVKIFRILICCEGSLSPYALSQALGWSDGKQYESLSQIKKVQQLTRDFAYSTRFGVLKFAHSSAIDYFQNHRQDHQEYSDAACHAEMASTCITYISHRELPAYLPDPDFAWQNFTFYAEHFWVKHCAKLDREQRESRGISNLLLNWLVKDENSRSLSPNLRNLYAPLGARKIPNIKIAMLLASICNFVEIGNEIIQFRLSAREPLKDLFSGEGPIDYTNGLYTYVKGLDSHWQEFGRIRFLADKESKTPIECAINCNSDDMIKLLRKYEKAASLSSHRKEILSASI